METSAFRVDSKSWFLTYPRCSLDKEVVLDLLKAKGKPIVGAVVASELHEDGSPHVHVYLLLGDRFNCRNPRFWDLGSHHGNYQAAKSLEAVIKYIKKDGNYLEFGTLNWEEKLKSRKEHRRYLGAKLIGGTPLLEVVQEDPALLFGLKKLREDLTVWTQLSLKPTDASDVRGIWIWGPPGVGKSRYVRCQEPSLYLKAQNKWWDGYIGEKAVLIDDFDKQGTCLSHLLKIWADRYACSGEIKGGQVPLVHERFYVTSNYSIDQLFDPRLDQEVNAALKRRFKVINMLPEDLGLIRVRTRSLDLTNLN